jgi:L-amino acid N-acyltransferase YncA
MIRDLTPRDAPGVLSIYREGIATGHATFNTEVPPWDDWDRAHLATCRLVFDDEAGLLGWAALTPVSGRCVYEGVQEVSVYVSGPARGRGIGLKLLEHLVTASEAHGIWTLQAGIFPENYASLRIHERCGFRQVGVREKFGQMNGLWRDVLLLERRSRTVGVPLVAE